MKLFLDIETLPAPGDKMDLIKSFWEDSRRKNSLSKELKGVNDFDTFFRNTSFQGEFGRILCIGYAVDDQPAECLFGDEKELLRKFWAIAKDATLFVGHNVMDFDLRFIYKRSVILGIRPTKKRLLSPDTAITPYLTQCANGKSGVRAAQVFTSSPLPLVLLRRKRKGLTEAKSTIIFWRAKKRKFLNIAKETLLLRGQSIKE